MIQILALYLDLFFSFFTFWRACLSQNTFIVKIIKLMNTMYMLALNFQLSFHQQFSSGRNQDLKRKRGWGWVGRFGLRIGLVQIVVSAELYGVEVKIVVTL